MPRDWVGHDFGDTFSSPSPRQNERRWPGYDGTNLATADNLSGAMLIWQFFRDGAI